MEEDLPAGQGKKCLLLSEQSDNGASWAVQRRQVEVADIIGITYYWILLAPSASKILHLEKGGSRQNNNSIF